MAYKLRVNFSGLCFFEFIGGIEADPHRARVLMVNATNKNLRYPGVDKDDVCVHWPRLVLSRRHIVDTAKRREPSQIRPAADGEDLAIYDLLYETVNITTQSSQKDVTVERKHPHTDLPKTPRDYQVPWFEWTAPLKKLHPRIAGLHTSTGAPGVRVATIIEFDDGRISTREVGKKYDDTLAFQFRRYDKSGDPVYGEYAMADRVQLEIAGLSDPVKLVFANGENVAVEGSAGKTIDISLTNLCDDREWRNIEWLTDFLWFYNLVEWHGAPPPAQELIIPKVLPSGNLTPSTGTCPPAAFG